MTTDSQQVVPARKRLNGQRNQCPTCNEYFTRNSVFDKHREGSFKDGTRRCLSTPEMMAIGMWEGPDGFWRGAKMPDNAISRSTMRAPNVTGAAK